MQDAARASIDALKKKLQARNKPTELHTILRLYFGANSEDVYISHFAGFKLLLDWLSPIKLPSNTNEIPIVFSKVVASYEHIKLAEFLGTYPFVILATEFYIKGETRLWTPKYEEDLNGPTP